MIVSFYHHILLWNSYLHKENDLFSWLKTKPLKFVQITEKLKYRVTDWIVYFVKIAFFFQSWKFSVVRHRDRLDTTNGK